jgi:hypothetical protein
VIAPEKALVLDIDGVLGHWQGWRTRSKWQRHMDESVGIMGGIDPVSAACLNEILRRTGARVLISSTIRTKYDEPEELYGILKVYGIEAVYLGVTPRLFDYSEIPVVERGRGAEIQTWLDAHPEITTFAIVDDGWVQHLNHRLVKTEYEDGLQDRHVELLVAMLGEIQ